MFTLTVNFADGYTSTERWDTLGYAVGVAADYATSDEQPLVDSLTVDTDEGVRVLTFDRPS